MNVKKLVESIQTAGYNGAHTVHDAKCVLDLEMCLDYFYLI